MLFLKNGGTVERWNGGKQKQTAHQFDAPFRFLLSTVPPFHRSTVPPFHRSTVPLIRLCDTRPSRPLDGLLRRRSQSQKKSQAPPSAGDAAARSPSAGSPTPRPRCSATRASSATRARSPSRQ